MATAGIAFQYADASLKRDRAFVLAVVAKNSCAFEYADASLQKDKAFVLAVLAKDGELLEFADPALKKDKDVVMAAAATSRYITFEKHHIMPFAPNDSRFRDVPIFKFGEIFEIL